MSITNQDTRSPSPAPEHDLALPKADAPLASEAVNAVETTAPAPVDTTMTGVKFIAVFTCMLLCVFLVTLDGSEFAFVLFR